MVAESRSRIYALNAGVAVAMSATSIVAALIVQRFFVNALGLELLGLNGLFTNLVAMLAVAELGFGSAIIFKLYQPLAVDDRERIAQLMRFYRNGYRIVGSAVLLIGLGMALVTPVLAGSVVVDSVDVRVAFLLFLADAVFSYVFGYKRSMLYADRRNYIINAVHLVAVVTMSGAQIAILLTSRDYYLFLIVRVVCRLLENIVLTVLVDRRYPYLSTKTTRLGATDRADALKQVRGLAFHRIAGFAVLGADNIVLALLLGLRAVGLYANYYMLYAAIVSICGHMFEAVKSTIGDFLVRQSDNLRSYSVFRQLFLINFFLATLGAVGFLAGADAVVRVWLGSQFQLTPEVAIAMAVALFFQLLRLTFHTFKEASGVFYVDRWVPVAEALLHVLASVALVEVFGVVGVPVAAILSTAFLFAYSYGRFVYRPLFRRTWRQYYGEVLRHIGLALLLMAGVAGALAVWSPEAPLLDLLWRVGFAIVAGSMALFLVFGRSDDFVSVWARARTTLLLRGGARSPKKGGS